MKFLLDTNVMIHLFNGHQPLTENVMKHPPSELAISGYTEAETAYGIEYSAAERRESNRVARVLAMSPFTRIYHDESISWVYGNIKAHLKQNKIYSPSNELDIFIAATAIAKNLILITENKKDFESIPNLQFKNWS